MFEHSSVQSAAKWQDKFMFNYGEKQQLAGGGVENSALLSPTTPTTTTMTKCCIPSPFQVPMPSDDVFFGTKATATFLNPSSAPAHLHENFSILDTPNSAFCPASTSTTVSQGDLVFKFEPEHIELMKKCDQFMDSNFDDVNCQIKHFSPCHTPPTGIYNNFDFSTPNYQTPLPPINTIQSSSYGIQYSANNSSSCTYEDHYIDTSFLAQFPSPVPRIHSEVAYNDSYSQPANFNVTGASDDKPNREFKHIDFHGEGDEKERVCEKSDLKKRTVEVAAVEVESSEPVSCLWTDCHQEFCSQTKLVAHIEKLHIEGRKGEDFCCFWRGCSREQKPFNARYKLLIHMRVHSGEKPNKCPVSEKGLIKGSTPPRINNNNGRA